MAFTIYPFIIATKSEKADSVLMNHERIHLAQQKEMWVLPFYIWYFASSIFNMFKYLSLTKAYKLNRFEAEAFAHQEDMTYLKVRGKGWLDFDAKTLRYRELEEAKPIDVGDRMSTVAMILTVIATLAIIALAITDPITLPK